MANIYEQILRGGAPTSRAASQGAQQLLPQDEEALRSSLLGTTLSGLGWVGETLDKPGRALRGLLSGDVGSLANLIPFSDTMGLTDPTEGVSGRDLLEQYGILNENEEGLDAGDVAGFGAEVLLDPLMWIGGPALALTKAGKDAVKSGKILAGAMPSSQVAQLSGRYADDLVEAAGDAAKAVEGEPLRKLLSFNVPRPYAWAFGSKKPINLMNTNLGMSPETVAGIADKMYYGAASPARVLRPLFSENPFIKKAGTHAQAQKLADAAHDSMQQLARAEAASEGALKSVFAQTMDDLGKVRTDSIDEAEFMLDFDSGLKAALEEMEPGINQGMELAKRLVKDDATFDELDNAASSINNVIDTMRKHIHGGMDNGVNRTSILERLRDAGLDIKELQEGAMAYHPRSITLTNQLMEDFAAKEGLSTEFGNVIARMDPIRGIPTAIINQLTSDPMFVGGIRAIGDDAALEVDRLARGATVHAADMDNIGTVRRLEGDQAIVQFVNPDKTGKATVRLPISELTPLNPNSARKLKDAGSLLRKHAKTADLSDIGKELLKQLADESLPGGIGGSQNYLDDLLRLAKQNKVDPSLVDDQVRLLHDQAWGTTGEQVRTMKALAEDYGITAARMTNASDPAGYKGWDDLAKSVSAVDGNFPELGLAGSDDASGELWMMMEDYFAAGKRIREQKTNFLHEAIDTVMQEAPGSFGTGAAPSMRMTNKLLRAQLAKRANLIVAENQEQVWDAVQQNHLKNADKIAKDLGIDSPATWGADLNPEEYATELFAKVRQSQEHASAVDFRFGVDEVNNIDDVWALYPDADDVEGFMTRLQNYGHGVAENVKVWTDDDLQATVNYMRKLPESILRQVDQPPIKSFPKDQLAQATKEFRKLHDSGRPVTLVDDGDVYNIRLSSGLFSKSAMEAEVDYLHRASHVLASLQAMKHTLTDKNIVNTGGVGVPLGDVWKGMGLTDEGLKNVLHKHPQGIVPSNYKRLKGAEGSAALKDSANKLFVDPMVAKSLAKSHRASIDPSTIGPLMKGWKSVLSAYRGMLYTIWPASQVRNRLEGMSKNWMTENFSGWSELASRRAQMGYKTFKFKGTEYDLEPFLERFRATGIDPMTDTKTATRFEESVGAGIDVNRGTLRGATSIFGEFGAEIGSALKNPIQSAKEGAFNPMGFQNAPRPVNIIRNIKRQIKGEELLPTRHTESTFALAKAGQNVQQTVEFSNRFSPWLHQVLAKDMDDFAAAAVVKKTHYDYSALSDFEKKYMRNTVLFYTFARKNLPYWVKELANNPGGKPAQIIRGMGIAQDEATTEGYMPPWLAEGFAFKVGKGKDGRQNYAYASSILGMNEAFNRFVPGHGVGGMNWERTTQKHLGMLTSPIQKPLEMFTGKSFFTGKPLSDQHKTPTDYDLLNQMVYGSPWSRATAQVRKLVDPGKPAYGKILSMVVGGAGITTQDVEKSINLQLRQLIQDELTGEEGARAYENLYIKDPSVLSPESQKKYAFLKKLKNDWRKLNPPKEKAQ